MPVHVFGIRHHGPGSARSLVQALGELAPDIVLVEGPPDAEDVLPLLAHEKMRPPVALLIYPADAPQNAAFFPFAVFSPEWQALRFALERGIPARFIDLPQANQLAILRAEKQQQENRPEEAPPIEEEGLSDDPLGALAHAAGYSDRELWWEQQVEQRQDATGLFDGIRMAMAELRNQGPVPKRRENEREAFMRTRIRAAQKDGFQKIAVVCGAWHSPALTESIPAKHDQELLKDLPKTKVSATWIPWTYSRLSYRSGYGAGVESPGWYHHLWESSAGAPVRWLARVARLLREQDLDASSASVIEAARLAEALAAIRGIPMPGLAEVNEAALAVICHAESAPMSLIRQKLEIGDFLGEVPADTPSVPIQRDLEAIQKRLRMKVSTEIKPIDLDLREENDRQRSALLHRLNLLGIAWGHEQLTSGKVQGSFHELWQLQWSPEFAVQLIEANIWGNTVESAASAKAVDSARTTQSLPELSSILNAVTLAILPLATDQILAELQSRAAVAADVRSLMDALPPLAHLARYGDVRGTKAEHILPVFRGLFERITVGVLPACASLDDTAAASMATSISRVEESVSQLDMEEYRQEWREVLSRILDSEGIHGLVRGYACRLLLDQHLISTEELARRARLALSPAVPPGQAASWVEGLLKGSGLTLLHQDELWKALDGWLIEFTAEQFQEVLPLLRRAFSGFAPAERRQMGGKVKSLGRESPSRPLRTVDSDTSLDHSRARRVLPVLAQILGVDVGEEK